MRSHSWRLSQKIQSSIRTRQDLADLIQAFDDIFYPRVNLCPNGRDRAMDAKKYLHVMSGMGKVVHKPMAA